MKENFFSPIAAEYERFRPQYPQELFAHLASLAPGKEMAWDCATGSGQAARELVHHFDAVIATDISDALMAQAPKHPRISYRNASALNCGLADGSADLVTVANAMHWFHGPDFEREVRRVVRPGGVVAAWSFAFSRITPEVDRITRKLHDEIVDPFWIEPNRIVENGYRDLHFPFAPLPSPAISMISHWSLEQLEGYMRTWSASVKYSKHHGVDPVDLVHEELLAAWGDPNTPREVRWSLNLLIGQV